MIDLTKYLFYKATDRDYGKKEFDFSAFNQSNFNSLDNTYGGASNLDGIAGQIYDFLLGKGIPPVGAAAILGNIQGESSLNPAAINPDSGASGLCQWWGSRFNTLKALANSRGVSWTDVNVQLELLGSEFDDPYYKKVHDVIMSSTEESDLEYATWYWGRHFEVFFDYTSDFEESKHETAKRYEYAKAFYAKYLQSKSSTE